MGKRGPARTPTAKLLKRGSWKGAERDGEIQPERGDLSCPDWLCDHGKEVWLETVAVLDATGILTLADQNVLAMYADTWARWHRAAEFVRENGESFEFVTGGGQEVFKPYPEATVAKQLITAVLQLGAKLGLSPADRSGMKAGNPSKSKDTVSGKFLEGKTA